MKMPAAKKAKWLKALRSGEYDQCEGTLTNGKGGFCCLGVLQHTLSRGKCEVDSFDKYLTEPTLSWYEDQEIDVGVHGWSDPILCRLIAMNDDVEHNYDGASGRRIHINDFEVIADYIEQHVETT